MEIRSKMIWNRSYNKSQEIFIAFVMKISSTVTLYIDVSKFQLLCKELGFPNFANKIVANGESPLGSHRLFWKNISVGYI
jgi:hypothetical protein